jgi:integrase
MTGMRQGEQLRLTWGDIRQGVAHSWTWKDRNPEGRERKVPLTPEAWEFVAKMRPADAQGRRSRVPVGVGEHSQDPLPAAVPTENCIQRGLGARMGYCDAG